MQVRVSWRNSGLLKPWASTPKTEKQRDDFLLLCPLTLSTNWITKGGNPVWGRSWKPWSRMSGDGSSGTDWRWRRCNRSPHALQPRSFTSQRARYHQRHRGLGITHTPEEDETGCQPPRTAMTSCTKHVSRGCPPPSLLPSWQKVSQGFWSQCLSADGERIFKTVHRSAKSSIFFFKVP